MKETYLLRRTAEGLVPASRSAREALGRVKPGELIRVALNRPRSLRQHRLYWALLKRVAEATEWRTPDRLHLAIKLALGKYDLMEVADKVVPVPHRTSFSAMSQEEFKEFFDQAIHLICERILPGVDSAQLLAEIDAMLGPADA